MNFQGDKMSDAGSQKLYDILAGSKVFPNLTVSIIIKNIKNGKLKPHHQISGAGVNRWKPLQDIPELEIYFHPEKAPTVQRTRSSAPAKSTKKLYDIRIVNNITEGIEMIEITRKIRAGEFNETDKVRVAGKQEWKMAGDVPEFERYFDLRRTEVRAEGLGAYKKDTGKPFYSDLLAPFKYTFTKNFFFNLIVLLVVLLIPILVGNFPMIAGPINWLTTLYIFAYYFRVINDSGAGGNKFPATMDFTDFIGELFKPAVSFFLTRVVAMLPLFAYLGFVKLKGWPFFAQLPVYGLILSMPWAVLAIPLPAMEEVNLGEAITESIPEDMEGAEVLTDTIETDQTRMLPTGEFEFMAGDLVVWVCLIFFLLYFPISLLRQSSYGEVWPTLNIPAVLQSITRAPGPYLALVGLNLGVDFIGFIVLLLIGLVTGGAAVFGAMQSIITPGSAQVVGALMMIFPLIAKGVEITSNFIKMYLMGRFMYQNARRMGWD
jgi:hypothetical protein